MLHSQQAVELVKKFEGFRPEAYYDNGAYAIGYGHRGTDVVRGQRITLADAEILLQFDLKAVAGGVLSLVSVPISQSQLDALVSLVYNIGMGNFARSKLLLKLNARAYQSAAAQFRYWRKSVGRVLPGLVKRREAEAVLFLGKRENGL